MDEPVTLEEKVARLEDEVGSLRAICAHLYLAIIDMNVQNLLLNQTGLAGAFRLPEEDSLRSSLKAASQKLEDRMEQARALIWSEDGDGAEG